MVDERKREAQEQPGYGRKKLTFSILLEEIQSVCTYWLIMKHVGSPSPATPNVISMLVGVTKAVEASCSRQKGRETAQRNKSHRKLCIKYTHTHSVRSRI